MLYINKHHYVYIIALGKQFGRGTQLYKDFNEWVQENGFQYETNVIKIGLRLKTLKLVSEDGKSPMVKSRLKVGNCYTFLFDDLKPEI